VVAALAAAIGAAGEVDPYGKAAVRYGEVETPNGAANAGVVLRLRSADGVCASVAAACDSVCANAGVVVPL
jgi:hypothetical protein